MNIVRESRDPDGASIVSLSEADLKAASSSGPLRGFDPDLGIRQRSLLNIPSTDQKEHVVMAKAFSPCDRVREITGQFNALYCRPAGAVGVMKRTSS
jgi:hypothetical protein